MKKIAGIGIMFLLTSGCAYNDIKPDCYHGKVILSSCCTGSTFINLESPWPIGIATRLNEQEYTNVIQVPGYLNNGDVYINLRKFDPDKDSNLFPNPHCYCLIAIGMDVPMMVVTAMSYSSCPEAKSGD